MTKTKNPNKFLNSILILALPISLYLILAPVELFAGNRKDFLFRVSDFVWMFLVISIFLVLIGGWIVSILPSKLHEIVKVVILIGGVGSYLQYMFLNVKLSEPDGSLMDWSKMQSAMVVNTILWCAFVVVMIVLRFVLKKYWGTIEIGLPIC